MVALEGCQCNKIYRNDQTDVYGMGRVENSLPYIGMSLVTVGDTEIRNNKPRTRGYPETAFKM